MFKDYYEVRNWLENFIPYTYSKKNLGLERIRHLLKLLGNPQTKFKSIHIAGTSGKGSTAFYISQLLSNCKSEIRNPRFASRRRRTSLSAGEAKRAKSETNYNSQITKSQKSLEHSDFGNVSKFDIRASNLKSMKIGLHISPHLSYIGERMQINDVPISPVRLIRLIGRIRPIVEKIQRVKPDLVPSYFEILVAASFLYFAQEKVDFAVVEVGLGGRLDATNVLKPEITVITNVGLDHTEILGKTIEKIALEKAGIIKKGIPVVIGAGGKALKVIEKVARLASAPLIVVNGEPRWTREKKAPLIKVNTHQGLKSLKSVFEDCLIIYKDIERYIGSSFASSNFLLAFSTVLALGFEPSKQVVSEVSKLVFPGRFELIDKNVILDGAHNADKIKFLIKKIKDSYTNNSNYQSGIVLVVGFKKGKDWQKMVDLLVKNLPIKKIIATKFWAPTDTGFFAAVEPEEIAKYVSSIKYKVLSIETCDNSQEAVINAISNWPFGISRKTKGKRQKPDSVVLVTGSLYLVGETRTLWKLPEL